MLKIKSFIRKIASKYFWKTIYLFKVLYYNFFLNKSKDVIVVLTPGKVGSSSLYESLKSKFTNSYIFHIHFLSDRNIAEGIRIHKNSARRSVPNHFITSLIFNKIFVKKFTNIKFVVLFREPIDRYVSDAYQNSNRLLNKIDNTNNSEIISSINVGLSQMAHMDYLENWVVDELKSNLDYDFFDKSKLDSTVYYVDSNEKYDFLFMKMEYMNEYFGKATLEFFDEELKLINANDSTNKGYKELYKEAKSNIIVTPGIVNKMKSYGYTNKIYPLN
jgi:hypothetical protein